MGSLSTLDGASPASAIEHLVTPFGMEHIKSRQMSLSRTDVSRTGEEPLDTPQHTCARDIRRQRFCHCRGMDPGRNRLGGLFKAAPEYAYDGLEALKIDVILRP